MRTEPRERLDLFAAESTGREVKSDATVAWTRTVPRRHG